MDVSTTLLSQMVAEGVVLVEKPNVQWNDIIGMEDIKHSLRQHIQVTSKNQQLTFASDVRQAGILLFGPSGTGKTMIGKALATELIDATLITVFFSKIMSEFYNDPKRIARNIFHLAKSQTPCIILMKDIDVLVPPADTDTLISCSMVRQEVMEQMRMFESSLNGIIVIGITSAPWSLEEDILKWFSKIIYIALPGRSARVNLLEHLLRDTYNYMTHKDFDFVVEKTSGLSEQQICHIVHETLSERLRSSHEATHFREILLDPVTYGQMPFWVRCSSNDHLAEEMNYADVPDGRVYMPPISSSDILHALKKLQPPVTDKLKVLQHENFLINCCADAEEPYNL